MSRLELPHLYSGKVRELYEVSHDRLLIVASDRVSAFDVILDDPIPDKGRVLTATSVFWFERTRALVPNHLVYLSHGHASLALDGISGDHCLP